MSDAPACPMCGWRGTRRDRDGRCIDYASCAHRIVLQHQGRPRDSGCACVMMPCPCHCHVPHIPEIALTGDPPP
jgi:hypothetical protein